MNLRTQILFTISACSKQALFGEPSVTSRCYVAICLSLWWWSSGFWVLLLDPRPPLVTPFTWVSNFSFETSTGSPEILSECSDRKRGSMKVLQSSNTISSQRQTDVGTPQKGQKGRFTREAFGWLTGAIVRCVVGLFLCLSMAVALQADAHGAAAYGHPHFAGLSMF